jgi:hypothetical protein
MPANASGSLSVVEEKPSSLTLATCSHRSTGGLSIETLPPGSNAPKKKLCQDSVHAAHGRVVERVGRNLADVDQAQHRRAGGDQRQPSPRQPTRRLLIGGTLV